MDTRRLLLIVVCAFAGAYGLHVASRQLRVSRGIQARVTTPATSVAAASRSLRPNFPYSVIPGGAYSPAELRYADKRDRLVSEHYADFNMKSARLVRLTEDRYQYVSYRLRDHIFWTNKKLRIPKGEVLLTDGENYARTRCGNRLSTQRQPNTSGEEPSARVLSLPPFSPAQLKSGELRLAPAPPIGELAQTGPALPLDLPRLAPYVAVPVLGNVPVGQQIWAPGGGAPIASAPISPGFVPISAPGPSSPPINTPGGTVPPITPTPPVSTPTPPVSTPTPPLIPTPPGLTPTPPGGPTPPGVTPTPPGPPVDTPTVPINEVPEPASLTLLVFGVCLSLGLLVRMMRTDTRPEED